MHALEVCATGRQKATSVATKTQAKVLEKTAQVQFLHDVWVWAKRKTKQKEVGTASAIDHADAYIEEAHTVRPPPRVLTHSLN
jgi:uncharacterized protein YaiL (DUF2058 family)